MALLLSLMLALLIVYSIKSCCESSFTVTTPIYTLKDANVGLKKDAIVSPCEDPFCRSMFGRTVLPLPRTAGRN